MLQRNKCVICAKTEFVDIYKTEQYPLLFTPLAQDNEHEFMDLYFIGCLHCGCVQLKELADPKKLYEDAYNVVFNYPTLIKHYDLFSDFIKNNIILDNEIFEIGGSNGALARVIKSKIETKYTILDLCDRNPNIEDVEFIQGNCEEIDCPDNTTIVMSHVFEHLYEPDKMVETFAKKNIRQVFISNPDMIELMRQNDLSVINFEHTYFCDTVYLDHLFNKHGYFRKDTYSFEGHSIFYNYVHLSSQMTNIVIESTKITKNVYLLDEVKTYLTNRENVITELKFENDVFICPAGNYGQMIYHFLNPDNKKRILGFLDGDTFKIDKKVYGTNIHTFKKDKVCEYENLDVVLCVEKFRDEIKREISALNSNVTFIDI